MVIASADYTMKDSVESKVQEKKRALIIDTNLSKAMMVTPHSINGDRVF